MTSRKFPAIAALIGVVVALGLFFLLKDDTGDQDVERAGSQPSGVDAGDSQGAPGAANEPDRKRPRPEPEPAIEIVGGAPEGGVQELEFTSGGEASFTVRSDADDELHLHGYDLTFDVRAGKPREIAFDARIEGVFELESHSTGELLAEISVVPG